MYTRAWTADLEGGIDSHSLNVISHIVSLAREEGIKVTGVDEDTPLVSPERITLKGGKKGEPFILTDGAGTCATNREPYDAVVSAILKELKAGGYVRPKPGSLHDEMTARSLWRKAQLRARGILS